MPLDRHLRTTKAESLAEQGATSVPFRAPRMSVPLLPVRLSPEANELTSSWLVRLAAAHGMKLQSFCHLLWPRQVLWHLDFDRNPIANVLTTLSRITSVPAKRAEATSLATYGGKLSETSAAGNAPWILPLGKIRFLRRLFGQQFCPACLAEKCYLRKDWRLAFVTACPKHGSALMDRCPQCETPLHFHRLDMGDRNSLGHESPAVCFRCQFDLREAKPIAASHCDGASALQARLLGAAEVGSVAAPNGTPLYSHLYFQVLRQLVRLLMHKTFATRLQKLVSEATGATFGCPHEAHDFERLGIAERACLLRMVAWLLEEWPHRFVAVCRETRTYSSTLLRDMRNPPFWYWSVVREHLYVVYTPWRSSFAAPPNSYATLTQSIAAPTARTLAQRRRLEFVQRHPHLWRSRRRLAKALSASGLYSPTVHFSQIEAVCRKLVARCRANSGATNISI